LAKGIDFFRLAVRIVADVKSEEFDVNHLCVILAIPEESAEVWLEELVAASRGAWAEFEAGHVYRS
jgi:hypothetical protein